MICFVKWTYHQTNVYIYVHFAPPQKRWNSNILQCGAPHDVRSFINTSKYIYIYIDLRTISHSELLELCGPQLSYHKSAINPMKSLFSCAFSMMFLWFSSTWWLKLATVLGSFLLVEGWWGWAITPTTRGRYPLLTGNCSKEL